MTRLPLLLSSILLVSGCAGGLPGLRFGGDRGLSPPEVSVTEEPGEDVLRPRARSGSAPTPAEAPPQADTTGYLGETLAGLGAPTETGLWLTTGLVAQTRHGRVETASGDSVSLELRPSGGDPGAGSQLSLAGMQALGIPLSALATLQVYIDG